MLIGEFFAVILVGLAIFWVGRALVVGLRGRGPSKHDLLTVTRQRDRLEAALLRVRDNPDNAYLEASIALDELNASRYKALEN